MEKPVAMQLAEQEAKRREAAVKYLQERERRNAEAAASEKASKEDSRGKEAKPATEPSRLRELLKAAQAGSAVAPVREAPGEPVKRVDTAELEAARAKLSAVEAELAQLAADGESQSSVIAAAKARTDKLAAELNGVLAHRNRLERELEAAKAAHGEMRAHRDSLKQELAEAKATGGGREPREPPGRVAEFEVQLNALQAKFNEALIAKQAGSTALVSAEELAASVRQLAEQYGSVERELAEVRAQPAEELHPFVSALQRQAHALFDLFEVPALKQGALVDGLVKKAKPPEGVRRFEAWRHQPELVQKIFSAPAFVSLVRNPNATGAALAEYYHGIHGNSSVRADYEDRFGVRRDLSIQAANNTAPGAQYRNPVKPRLTADLYRKLSKAVEKRDEQTLAELLFAPNRSGVEYAWSAEEEALEREFAARTARELLRPENPRVAADKLPGIRRRTLSSLKETVKLGALRREGGKSAKRLFGGEVSGGTAGGYLADALDGHASWEDDAHLVGLQAYALEVAHACPGAGLFLIRDLSRGVPMAQAVKNALSKKRLGEIGEWFARGHDLNLDSPEARLRVSRYVPNAVAASARRELERAAKRAAKAAAGKPKPSEKPTDDLLERLKRLPREGLV